MNLLMKQNTPHHIQKLITRSCHQLLFSCAPRSASAESRRFSKDGTQSGGQTLMWCLSVLRHSSLHHTLRRHPVQETSPSATCVLHCEQHRRQVLFETSRGRLNSVVRAAQAVGVTTVFLRAMLDHECPSPGVCLKRHVVNHSTECPRCLS